MLGQATTRRRAPTCLLPTFPHRNFFSNNGVFSNGTSHLRTNEDRRSDLHLLAPAPTLPP